VIISLLVWLKSTHSLRRHVRKEIFTFLFSVSVLRPRQYGLYWRRETFYHFPIWSERKVGLCDRETDFRWWNVFDDMCRMGRWSFSLGLTIDVNRSTFDEDMWEKLFYIFIPSDPDLWPLDLQFDYLVRPTLVQCYVSTKLEVSIPFPFRENLSHGTNGQTERRIGCNARYGLL